MNPNESNNTVSTLRDAFSEAERLVSEGISLLKADQRSEASAKFTQARSLYERLATSTADQKITLLLERRIRGRIDRILRGIEQKGKVEYFEELDETGGKTGRREVSTIAHLKGMRHASVNVLICDRQGQPLLQLRAPNAPVFPGKWTFAASGHVAGGETPKDAAKAETLEEISSPITPQEEAALPDSIKQRLILEEDGLKWLRFHPKGENLHAVGPENAHDGYLNSVEFAYLDNREKEQLMSAVERHLRQQTKHGIARVLWDVDESANTLLLFTFDQGQQNELNRVVQAIEKETGIPRGMLTDNVEKKSLYVYHLIESEEELVEVIIDLKKKGGKPVGPGLVSGFQWVDLDQTVKEFNEHPERYTDAFVPFLSDQTIVTAIKRLLHA